MAYRGRDVDGLHDVAVAEHVVADPAVGDSTSPATTTAATAAAVAAPAIAASAASLAHERGVSDSAPTTGWVARPQQHAATVTIADGEQ